MEETKTEPGAPEDLASEPRRSLARRIFGTWGKLAIAFAIAGVLIATGKLTFGPLVDTFAIPWLIALVFLLHISVMGAGVIRWWMLLHRYARDAPGDGGARPSLWELYVYTWIGLFFGSIAPSVIAIDIARYQYLRKQGVTSEAIVTSLLVDRTCGMISLLTLVLVCSWSLVPARTVWATVAVIAALVAIGLAVVMFGGRRLERFRIALRAAARARLTTVVAILIGIVAHGLKVVMFWVIVWGLDLPHTSAEVIEVAPVGYLIESIPITPSGFGTAHAAFEHLLTGGAAIFNVYFVTKMLFGVAGGVIWVLRKQRKPAVSEHSPK